MSRFGYMVETDAKPLLIRTNNAYTINEHGYLCFGLALLADSPSDPDALKVASICFKEWRSVLDAPALRDETDI